MAIDEGIDETDEGSLECFDSMDAKEIVEYLNDNPDESGSVRNYLDMCPSNFYETVELEAQIRGIRLW